MTMKLCVLASGSSGNCTFVGSAQTRILIDAGLSARRTVQRLKEIDVDIEEIDAVCVTHEHTDHVTGLRVLQKKHGLAVYANGGTAEALRNHQKNREVECRVFTTGAPFAIGDLHIEPFSVPHDAYEPVGFVVEAGGSRVGVVTDIGTVTELVREKLRTCRVVVIEANHDEELLQGSQRPWSLKQRIRGRQGHLSNRAAAAMMAEIAHADLRHLVLAHMSSECNTPRHALETFRQTLAEAGHGHITVQLASANRTGELLQLET